MLNSRLPRMLAHNASFVAKTALPPSSSQEDHRVVILSCMDSRLVDLLPKALNLSSNANVIKTAGAVLSHPFGGIMRSIIVALYALSPPAQEVFIVGHTDCGMGSIDPEIVVKKMQSEGKVEANTVDLLERSGMNVKSWLRGFESVEETVLKSCKVVRQHPFVPRHVPVHGLIICSSTGKLQLVKDGNTDEDYLEGLQQK